MQKPLGPKKGTTTPSKELQEEYRSQSSKMSGGSNKQKFSLQNMKEFKCEIDHQIAKCLDTLDRQGLKFLKETLRASKLFALNTQELNYTAAIDDEPDPDVPNLKSKNQPQKVEGSKNIQIKKVSKPDIHKKPATAKAQVRNVDSRNDLGQKIHKKLESLNIKTGKKSQAKSIPQKPKQIKSSQVVQQPSSTPEIAEQIQTDENHEAEQKEEKEAIQNLPLPIQQEIKSSFIEVSNQEQSVAKQEEIYTSQKVPQIVKQVKTEIAHHYYSVPKEQSNHQRNALKPFCKKQYKKTQGSPEKKDYGLNQIENQNNEQPRKIDFSRDAYTTSKGNSKIQAQPKERPQDEVEQEKKAGSRLEEKTQQSIYNSESSIPLQLMNLIEKIKKLPTNKLQKLEKVLQKFEDPNLNTSMLSLASQSSHKQFSYMKPYLPMPQPNQSEPKERSHSRSRLQKIEKASSIKSSMMKKYQQNKEISSFVPESLAIKESYSRVEPIERSLKLNEGEKEGPLVGQNKLSCKEEEKPLIIKQSKDDNSQLQFNQTFRAKQENLASSIISNQSGQKLIKISKKKSAATTLTIKIISNNGHPSLVALSSILIYNTSGAIIPIDELNLKQPTAKLLKLFTENNTEGWFTSLNNAVISIQGIMQSIGGIRIINFNKSEIQNNKQADLVQIIINEQLFWRGQLRGGSFKEDESYLTDIRVGSREFQFPMYNNSLGDSHVREGKFIENSWMNEEENKKGNEVVWLEKQSISKIKQLEQLDKNQSKARRIQSIRNQEPQRHIEQQQLQIKPEIYKQPMFQSFKPKEEKPYNLDIQISPAKRDKFKLQQSNDILGELSRSTHAKKKATNSKEEIQTGRKAQQLKIIKEKQREKRQDDEFEEIIKSLEKREKEEHHQGQQLFKGKEPFKEIMPKRKEQETHPSKGKKIAQKSLDDFMKDSLFEDLNQIGNLHYKPAFKKPTNQETIKQSSKNFESKKTVKNDLDNLIDELNDVIGSEAQQQTGQQFLIPELPQGNQLALVLLSNWGNQQYIGLNGVEIFNSNGDCIKPTQIISSTTSSGQLIARLFKSELMTSDESLQMKIPKSKKNVLLFIFSTKVEIAAIRIWNYNGHRVHNNIGVKKCQMRLDTQYIFSGEIKQNLGSAQDADKHCEYILFTESAQIIKKINEKDWVSRKQRNNEQERMLFKSTLENFHRPPTRNDQETVKKEVLRVEGQKEPFKLPRRMYFECEPPQFPEGFTLKFILHSSWGDRFFIGLNGLEIFNDKGEVITQNVSQIVADPSSISKLQGYERDKRVVTNLINGKNTTSCDSDTWLTPLLSDVQKIEKGRSNLILMDFSKSNRIAGINFYNYTKTPERGVRQIEVYLDNYLLYRGYLRKYKAEEGIIHTTVSFTREAQLLETMSYSPYNQDHLEQDVGLVNEGKILREGYSQTNQKQVMMSRPMTGKLVP